MCYNTTAPGIVLFLNRAKPKNRKGKVFLVNANQVFEKGGPKNFIPKASNRQRLGRANMPAARITPASVTAAEMAERLRRTAGY